MKRVFLDRPLEERIEVGGEVARHLGFSLRAAVGDRMGVADPAGNTADAEIVRISPTSVEFALRGRTTSPEPSVRVWLLQSFLKGDGMETVIRKAVEIGACGIVPLASERCVVRLEPGKAVQKSARWQKIAKEAAEQSGRGIIPMVTEAATMAEVRRIIGADTNLLVLHEESAAGIRSVLRQLRGTAADAPVNIAVAVGPEGGFSAAEIREWTDLGAVLTGLGPRVLRAETAGLVAVSAILFEAGQLGGD